MFAGDVEVDKVFPNNDVGDTITIISHLVDTEVHEEGFILTGGNVSKPPNISYKSQITVKQFDLPDQIHLQRTRTPGV